jgi:hypothetical protein
MNRVLLRMLVTIALLGAGVASAGTAASADTHCATGYTFFRSEPFGRWLSVNVNNDGRVSARGTVAGWFEAFHLCQQESWPYNRFTLLAPANGRYLTVDYANGNVVEASNTFEGGRELFDFVIQYISPDGLAVYSIRHLESGLYLTVATSGGPVRAGRTYVGYNESFAWVA